MNRLYIILCFLTATALVSCNGSKALTKKGFKLEEAGLTKEAADKYYYALVKKKDNVDAQVGMRNTGQMVLNELLADFSNKKNFGKKAEAVVAYQIAQQFQERVQKVGVSIDIASFYQSDYDVVKTSYMEDLYDEGTEFLEDENYSLAESKFKAICALDNTFRDANELQNIAFVEPLYQAGLASLEEGSYRTAYNKFSTLNKRVKNYKDVKELREESLALGKYPIAILPFDNGTTSQGLDVKMSAYALDALTDINDPFLRIVDRENLAQILDEQQLSLSGIFNEETALNVGELTGAKAILTGTVLGYSEETARMQSYNRTGYEKYKVKKSDSEGNVTYETKYKEVRYKEYTNTSTVHLSIQYKLVSLETGEILFTKISEKNSEDAIRYVVYDGDRKNFYPSKMNGSVNTNRSAQNQLHELLDARRKLRPMAQISGDLFSEQSNVIQNAVRNELIQIVK